MSLAACISRWPATTRSPFDSGRRRDEVGEHGRLRLLDLQEQRVVAAAAEQEHDPDARADAADADDLARHVDEAEALEQRAALARQRAAVVVEDRADGGMRRVALEPGRRELVERHDQRRLRDDPRLAVDEPRQLRVGVEAVVQARPRERPLGAWAALRLAPERRSSRIVAASTEKYQTSRSRMAASLPIHSR